MKINLMTTVFAPVLILTAGSVSAASARSGQIHVTKECSQYNGNAGDFCTITSSNIAEIKVGTKVYYDQAQNIPVNMLDSNVVLSVGTGNWAVGRCTVDGNTNLGLCTLSDGTGALAGFQARVKVTPFTSSPTEVNYHWDGTYSFTPIGVSAVVNGPGGANALNTFQTVSNMIALDASQSTSSNAGELTYFWAVSTGFPSAAIGGGNTATPAFQLGSPGTYQFTLTVTDAAGATAAATVTVQYL